jgi:DNA modification methylase
MITIHQIRLTDNDIMAVNAGREVEAFTVRNRMQFGFDKSKFSEAYLKHYSKSWIIDTDNLDEAFEIANGYGDIYKGTRVGRSYSASVGDIFVNDNGDCFVCDTFGFVAVGHYNMEA